MGLRGINVNGTNYAIDYNYLDNKPNGPNVPEFNALSDDGKVLSVAYDDCAWQNLSNLPGGIPIPENNEDGFILRADLDPYGNVSRCKWQSITDALGVGSSGWSGTDAVLMATLENDDGAYGLEWMPVDSVFAGDGLPDVPEGTGEFVLTTASSSQLEWTSIGDAMRYVIDELETVSQVGPEGGVGSATVMAYDGSDAYMVEGQGGQEILCSSNGSVHWESAHESILAVASLDSVAYETLGYPERNNSIAVYDTSCVPEWRTIDELIGSLPTTSCEAVLYNTNNGVEWASVGRALTNHYNPSAGDVLAYGGEDLMWQSLDDIVTFEAVSTALGAEDNDPGLVLMTANTAGGMMWGDITDLLEDIPLQGSGNRKVLVYDSSSGVRWDDPS